MSANLERERISVNGIETEVLVGGAGPKLLFLHSSWGPDAYSDACLRLLAGNFHVFAPYHPGYGRIDRPKHFASVGDLAYFYLDYLSQLSLSNVVMVGASIGGWIACEIAVRSTQRLSKLVLIDPVGIKTGDRERRDFVDFFVLGQPDRGRLEFQKPEFQSINSAAKSDEELTIIARGRDAEVHYGWNPFMHNPQLRHWLHRIDVPTLILRGSEDRVVLQQAHEAFRGLIPDAELKLISNAGHHPHLEQPADVAGRIYQFAAVLSQPLAKAASR
jgi:pimeloyl-ACP methyl ester carboxylesterase